MAKEVKSNKDVKNKKHFWKDFKAELKKVIWPTKKQLANNTLVVVAMVLATAAVVLVLDLAFEALNTYGINKLKTTVQNSISAPIDENNSTEEEHNHDNEETETSTENNNEDESKTTEQ